MRQLVTLEYPPAERLLYPRLRPGEVLETIEVSTDISADLDAAGEPVGIEALNADSTDGMTVIDLPDGLAWIVQAARHDAVSPHIPSPTLNTQ